MKLPALFSRPPLTRKEQAALAAQIAAIERETAGEIRIAIQQRRRREEKTLSLKELALRHFRRMGMEKTRDKTGVLAFLLMGEHQLQILADVGIDKKVTQGTWDLIAEEMTGEFKAGRFFAGLQAGLSRIGALLREHYPVRPGDRDELPNRVDLT